MSLFLEASTHVHQELLFDWPIYLTHLYMIERSKMNLT